MEEEKKQETKGKKKTKPMATFDMLMMDDESGDEIPSDVRTQYFHEGDIYILN